MKRGMQSAGWYWAAAALVASVGCGSDSNSKAQTGQGGAGGSGTSGDDFDPRCDMTKCPNDARFQLYNKEDCTNVLAGPCGPQIKAQDDCYKAHDKCDANGKQDVIVVQAACTAEDAATISCGYSLGGGGGK